MATYTYSKAVEQTIAAGEQIHQIVNGTATTEVTVEDGSKVPSIRKALLDNFYFKDPIPWQVGQTEKVFNQLRQFTDGSWWYAPSATASNPVSMGITPIGNPLWHVYSLDAVVKLTPQIREALRRTYAEAGYLLIGDFRDTGLVVDTATDVVLWSPTGIAYAYGGTLPHTIGAGETPVGNPNWTSKSDKLLRIGMVTPVTWEGFAGGADNTGLTPSTAAFQASVNTSGSINIPKGIFWIDDSINTTGPVSIFGVGRGLSVVIYTGSSLKPLFKSSLAYNSFDLIDISHASFRAGIPNCGPFISVSTNAASIAAPQVVVGDTDKMTADNIEITGDRLNDNYWNCGVEAIDCGGINLSKFFFNNRTLDAQNDPTTAGIRLRTTDAKVSVIRALTMSGFYILRAYSGIDTAPISNVAGGITSYYLSDFEIVGVKNGIKASNWCAAWKVTGHIDSTEECLNFNGAALTNARFIGCDLRKGCNGGTYTAGPMITLDYGEQIVFTGSTFSGINLALPDPSNAAFAFTNAYNGSYTFLTTISDNTFTKFHNVLGQTNGATNIVVGVNAYSQIADAITFDGNLDSSFILTSPQGSQSVIVALPLGDSTFNVSITPNRFKTPPNFAEARPVNNQTQNIRVVYDYAGSTASSLLFRVYGVTTAANFRFGVIVV